VFYLFFSTSKCFNKIVLSGLKKMLGYFYTGLHPVLLYLASLGYLLLELVKVAVPPHCCLFSFEK
jgi:hypothetical protein